MPRLIVPWSFIGTAAGGVLVGFVLTALVATLLASPVVSGGRPPESPVARTFMSGLLTRDVAALRQVRPAQGVAADAQRLQSQAAGGTQWEPAAVSYLGGGELDGVGVYVYVAAVHPLGADGLQVVPFTLTVQNGKIVRVQ